MNDRSKFEAAVHGAVVEAKHKAEADPSPVERYRLEIGEIFVGFALPDKDWYGLNHDEELVRWLKWRGKGSRSVLRIEQPSIKHWMAFRAVSSSMRMVPRGDWG